MNAAILLPFLLATSPGLAASHFDVVHLAGKWKVTGVRTGGGIQALTDDDGAYMGRIVMIRPKVLVWVSPSDAIANASVKDRCDGPKLYRMTGRKGEDAAKEYGVALRKLHATTQTPYGVRCSGGGTWGPDALHGAQFYPAPGGALAMTWYDGGVLRLERLGHH
jgi:hypothetical protein